MHKDVRKVLKAFWYCLERSQHHKNKVHFLTATPFICVSSSSDNCRSTCRNTHPTKPQKRNNTFSIYSAAWSHSYSNPPDESHTWTACPLLFPSKPPSLWMRTLGYPTYNLILFGKDSMAKGQWKPGLLWFILNVWLITLFGALRGSENGSQKNSLFFPLDRRCSTPPIVLDILHCSF